MIGNDTSLSIGFIIVAVGFVFTCINFYFTRKKENTEDLKRQVEANVKINAKLDMLCNNTNDIKDDIRNINTEVKEIREKQIRHDQEIVRHDQEIENIKCVVDELQKAVNSEK